MRSVMTLGLGLLIGAAAPRLRAQMNPLPPATGDSVAEQGAQAAQQASKPPAKPAQQAPAKPATQTPAKPASPTAAKPAAQVPAKPAPTAAARSEEHTSELQSHSDLVCRLLLEKKKTKINT